MSRFVHLHVHSDYSLLDGAAKIPNLVKRSKEMGMQHLALTDHGVMFGILPFYHCCRKEGINPIIGVEVYIAYQSRFERKPDDLGRKYYHLTLLAKNWQGYKNLIYLSSQGFLEGFYSKPRIDEELLFKYSEGLICLSGCLASLTSQLILKGKVQEAKAAVIRYKNIFQDDYYLEIQNHGIESQKIVNQYLEEWSKELSIPLVATNDSHYVMKEDSNAQDIIICIGTGKRKSDTDRMKLTNLALYLRSEEEMRQLFPHLPQAIENSKKIAERCQLEIKFPGPILPHYKVPEGFQDLGNYLVYLSKQGLKNRYSVVTSELQERLDYELDVIISMGFSGYFLIVADFIKYAKDNHIPVGPGRGSGAGSLVAYALRITDVDPLEYNLLFERFLNPERISMPDFDIDFCYERRSEVISYVTQKYGEDKVAQIITFGTLKPKAVVKDVARVLDIPFAESNDITKMIPDGPKVNLKEELASNQDLQVYINRGGVYKELFETALILEGVSRHTSTHAAGIVISKGPLIDYVPLYKDSKTVSISTQFSMEYLESCGLVKMDFLGLKTLTVLKNTEDLIRLKDSTFKLDSISHYDKKTFALLGEGKSQSVFQFESSGMQNVLKEAKPNSIEDLIALNALYRPGPMDFIPQFIESKHNPKKIKYPHKDLEEVLKPTYGVIIYQEQVMQVAQIIAGFSLGKADILRRAMGKKKEDEMQKMKADFVKGSIEKGYGKELGEKIFDILVPFAGYGFNKSHSAAYSVLAYKTAYLKANYPVEFMAANLTNDMNNSDKMVENLVEAKEMGITIEPPNINFSQKFFSVVDNKIVYGLSAVKNIGTQVIDDVLKERQVNGDFSSLLNFCERLDSRSINRKFLESGIYAGLFDGLGLNRASMIENLEGLLNYVSIDKKNAQRGQASLFGEDLKKEIAFQFENYEEFSRNELLEKERELLGFYVSGHPLELYRGFWEKYSDLSLLKDSKKDLDYRKIYNLVGMLSTLKVVIAKTTGAKMGFGRLQSFEGEVEVCFFQRVYAEYESLIQLNCVLLVSGRIDRNSPDIKLIAEKVQLAKIISNEKLANNEKEYLKEVHIYLKEDIYNDSRSFEVRSLIDRLYFSSKEGFLETGVFLYIPQGDKKLKFSLARMSLLREDEFSSLQSLREHLAVEEVQVLKG